MLSLNNLEEKKIFKKNYMTSGSMDKSFYEDFIYNKLQNNIKKMMINTLEKNEFIEYYALSMTNHNQPQCSYSELWLLDCFPNTKYYNGFYYPVFIPIINTSSPYALCRCGMDSEDDDDDDDDDKEDNNKSLLDILDMMPLKMRHNMRSVLMSYFD